ncbi:solute carrier family 13 member 2-like, partial [Stegodyphus dumicola]|uniref:solute carrier family 13 member 2-like n=1 Tax=Stegodyphus dumicola TaxID=202533 RepID=UPI0015A90A91
ESFVMFIGGFIVAIAVEDCMLHERIALKVLLIVGAEIKWLMLGFMLTSMTLSMWISNTAATAMMIPIAEAVIAKITNDGNNDDITPEENESTTKDEQVDEDEERSNSTSESETSDSRPSVLKVTLLLCICYSANIGGTGTITGTSPNLVLKGFLEEFYPESNEITFATWMMYNVPGMVVCVVSGWFYLWMIYIQCSKVDHNLVSKESIKTIISKRYAKLGPMTYHEMEVLILFFILISLWVLRDPNFITGWSEAIGSDA